MDPKTLKALTTIDGNEHITDLDYSAPDAIP
jgi:hypothetical protein